MLPDVLQRHRSLRLLVGIALALGVYFVFTLLWNALVYFSDVILLFFLAWIVAFILEPVSLFLQRRGLRRGLAVPLIYFALLVVTSGVIVLTIPSLEEEARKITAELTTTVSTTNLAALSGNIITTLQRLGLSHSAAQNVVDSLAAQAPSWITSFSNNAVNATTTLFTSLLSVLFNMFLILILSFYMMLDGDRLVESVVLKLPPMWIPDVRLLQRNIEQVFGGFFRAQLTVGAIYGACAWIILLALHQANGLLVAILAGMLMWLPFIGTVLSVIPPVLLLLLQSPPNELVSNLVILLVALIIAQNIVLQVLAPRIFGSQMGVSPLLLFAGLLIGAKVGGVWGAFFAGPIFAITFVMLRLYYDRMARVSPMFQSTPTVSTSTAAPTTAASASPASPTTRAPSVAPQHDQPREHTYPIDPHHQHATSGADDSEGATDTAQPADTLASVDG